MAGWLLSLVGLWVRVYVARRRMRRKYYITRQAASHYAQALAIARDTRHHNQIMHKE